jgi:hypothetical protein
MQQGAIFKPEDEVVRRVLICSMALTFAVVGMRAVQPTARSTVAERVQALTRDSPWKLVASVPMKFITHHPQGMVKIGDTLYVSAVEVKVRTRRLAQPADGYDRDAGEGTGHLFKVDMQGNLIADLKLGEGTIYHPGGIDYDGQHLWVPVAEYRPNSRSIIYRVDPGTMKATEVFRFADHLGGILRNTDDETLHGVSWGSRRFYRWTLGRDGRVTNAGAAPETLRTLNTSHYLDYQDCKYAGRRRMVCTGVTEMRQAPGGSSFRLGGIDLVDLRDGRPLHQVPVPLWTSGGLVMTQNPVWLEPFDTAQGRPFDTAQGRPFDTAQGRVTSAGLRGYFMPEDDTSTLYVYEVAIK